MFEGAVLQARWFFYCDVVVLFYSFWNFHVFLSFHSYFTFGSILCLHNLFRLLRYDPDLVIVLFLLIDPACSFTPIGIITRTLKIEDDGIYHWRVYLGGFALVVLSRLCQWYRRQGNDDESQFYRAEGDIYEKIENPVREFLFSSSYIYIPLDRGCLETSFDTMNCDPPPR